MAQVDLQGVGKLYGTTRALRDVNLSVADGEFLVLVGPSGCGKSTLLRMVAGLEDISEGELQIGGDRANEKAPRDRDVAMVFQSYALYPHMDVRRNMGFGLEVRKVAPEEIERRVLAAARLLDIEALLNRRPKDMSGGQRQRVAMGRAIVRSPAVFLFDEPLSNLDAALRSQMRAELKQLHARLKATMLYVTHDQVEAMTLADRICVLRDGVVQQVGTPAEVFERPVNRFVAGFIGSPSMNFLQGRYVDGAVRGEGYEVVAAGSASAEGADGVPPSPELVPGTKIGEQEVVLGLRPNDLRFDDGGGIKGEVVLVEPMGWEAHVHVRVGEVIVLVRVETTELGGVQTGTTVRLSPSRLHLFEADESGARLGTFFST
jgi:multiple sugar transport system ATP-binding protein